MDELREQPLVAAAVLEHKAAANALFGHKAFLQSAREYQNALDIVDSQLFATRGMKHTLCLNRARALFQHACNGSSDGSTRGADGDESAGEGTAPARLSREERLEFLEQSLAEARTAVELSGDDAKAQYTLGRIALELGKTRTAVTALRKALRLDPQVVRSRRVRKFIDANKDTPSLPERPAAGTGALRGTFASPPPAPPGRPGGAGTASLSSMAGWLRAHASRSRPFVVVAVTWYTAGLAAKAAGRTALGARIHQLLKLALVAAVALYLQGQVQQYSRSFTRGLVAKFFG